MASRAGFIIFAVISLHLQADFCSGPYFPQTPGQETDWLTAKKIIDPSLFYPAFPPPQSLIDPLPVYGFYDEKKSHVTSSLKSIIGSPYPDIIYALSEVSELPDTHDDLKVFIKFIISHDFVLPFLNQLLISVTNRDIRKQIVRAFMASAITHETELVNLITLLATTDDETRIALNSILSALGNQSTQQEFISALIELAPPSETLKPLIEYLSSHIHDFLLKYLSLLEQQTSVNRKKLLLLLMVFTLDKKGDVLAQLFQLEQFRDESFRQVIARHFIQIGRNSQELENLDGLLKKMVLSVHSGGFYPTGGATDELLSLLNQPGNYEDFDALPEAGEVHTTALLYLSEAFSQDRSCDSVTATEKAILLLRMVLANHFFLLGFLGHRPDINGYLPVSNNETLLQLLEKSVDENLISPAQAGELLLLFWKTPAIIVFFNSLYDYLISSTTRNSITLLSNYFSWFTHHGGPALNTVINDLPDYLRFVFFRTLAQHGLSGYQPVRSSCLADYRPLRPYPSALALLNRHVELMGYLPAAEISANFARLLTATGYHDSPAGTQEGMQTLTRPLSFTMQSVIASSLRAESPQQSVPLPEAPVCEPGEILTCETLVNRLNLELGKKLSLGYQFSPDQQMLQDYLKGAGVLTEVPETAKAASKQVISWINKQYVIWIFTLEKDSVKVMEIQKLASGIIEVRTNIGTCKITQADLAKQLEENYKPEKDVLATYLP